MSRSPDYLNLAIRTIVDNLECMLCDFEILDTKDRVELQRALTFVNNVKFRLYPVNTSLTILNGGKDE
jgi:hypothetical protein